MAHFSDLDYRDKSAHPADRVGSERSEEIGASPAQPDAQRKRQKLSPTMLAVVDAMANGIELAYDIRKGKWWLSDLMASSVIPKTTMNALLGRGLITRIDSGPTSCDYYTLTSAGRAAVTEDSAS